MDTAFSLTSEGLFIPADQLPGIRAILTLGNNPAMLPVAQPGSWSERDMEVARLLVNGAPKDVS